MKRLFFAMMLALPLAAAEPDMKALLEQGLVAEEVNGDLEAAAAAYQKLVAVGEAQQRFLATGLFRLAEVRRKQGQQDEAAALLQRLVAEHPAQKELVERAREALAGMGVTPPTPSADSILSLLDKEEAQEIAHMERLLRESPERAKKEHPLHLAAEKGWLELARRMIERGFDVNQVYQGLDEKWQRWRQKTPLAVAAEFGHKHLCGLLLDAGTDPNEGGPFRRYPIFMAIEKRHIGVVEVLLEAKPDLAVYGGFSAPTVENIKEGALVLGTPLHHAVRSDAEHHSAVLTDLLLKAGADVHAVTKEADAEVAGFWAGVAGLRGFQLGNRNPVLGMTPLFYAVPSLKSSRHTPISSLLESGASLEAKDAEGRTPIYYSQSHTGSGLGGLLTAMTQLKELQENPQKSLNPIGLHGSSLEALVELGAKLDPRDRLGRTPLLFAVQQHGFREPGIKTARQLVELGANPGAVDSQGNGLLHYAATGGLQLDEKSVEWLMSLPLDPSAKNKAGKTALDIALEHPKTGKSYFLTACLLSVSAAPEEGYWWYDGKLPLRRLYATMSENELPVNLARALAIAYSGQEWDSRKKHEQPQPGMLAPASSTQLAPAPLQTGKEPRRPMYVISKASSAEKAGESVRKLESYIPSDRLNEKLPPGTVLYQAVPDAGNLLDTSNSVRANNSVRSRITVRHDGQEKLIELAVDKSRMPKSTLKSTTEYINYAHYGQVILDAAAGFGTAVTRAKLIRQIDGKPVERIIDLETEDPSTWPRPITGDVLELLPAAKEGGE